MANTGSVIVSQEYKAVSQQNLSYEHYFLYSYSKTKTLITCSVVTSWSGSYSLYDKTNNQLTLSSSAVFWKLIHSLSDLS